MRFKITIILLIFGLLFLATPIFAKVQLEVNFPSIAGETLTGESSLPQTIKYVFSLAMAIAVFVVLISLVRGGLGYLSSTGNPVKMAEAKKQIYRALGGLTILIASYFVLSIINPQLLILKINKKPVISGVLLLNKEVFQDTGIMGVLSSPSTTEQELEKTLQQLLDNPSNKPKAVYIHSSISDLRDEFGDLMLGGSNTFYSALPVGFDPRVTHDTLPSFPYFTLQEFKPYGIYFLPGTNARVLTYHNPYFMVDNFSFVLGEGALVSLRTRGDTKAKADFEYVYPRCSMGTGPCVFELLDIGFKPNAVQSYITGNLLRDWLGGAKNSILTVPLSIEIKYNDTGIYLNSNKLGEEVYFNQSSEFLRDQNFDNKAKNIEIRNWIYKKTIDLTNQTIQVELIQKTDYLAILYEDEEFKGSLRIFFEQLDRLSVSVGNIILYKNTNIAKLDITSSQIDRYGKVEKPSSIQVFQMPDSEGLEKFKIQSCIVHLCAEKMPYVGSGNDFENKDCLRYIDSAAVFSLGGLSQPNDVPLSFYEPMIIFEKHKVARDVNGDGTIDDLDQVDFADNIKSLHIEGDCVVVLFENKVGTVADCLNKPEDCWEGGGPGGKSEVFFPWSQEHQNNNGYRDLTEDNKFYYHQIGRCKCTFKKILTFGIVDCAAQCASSIAIFPVINPYKQDE